MQLGRSEQACCLSSQGQGVLASVECCCWCAGEVHLEDSRSLLEPTAAAAAAAHGGCRTAPAAVHTAAAGPPALHSGEPVMQGQCWVSTTRPPAGHRRTSPNRPMPARTPQKIARRMSVCCTRPRRCTNALRTSLPPRGPTHGCASPAPRDCYCGAPPLPPYHAAPACLPC
jgi:hypothetical protein